MAKKVLTVSFMILTLVICNSNVFALEKIDLISNPQFETKAAIEEDSTRAINYYKVAFTRTSTTQAKARVTARTTTSSSGITSKITLQKYNESTEKYVNVTSNTMEENGYSIIHEKIFTISSTGKYRIKVTLNDGTTTQIKYKVLS